jgi:hypothetical protein
MSKSSSVLVYSASSTPVFRVSAFKLCLDDKILSQMYVDLHVKYSLFLPDFNQTCIFSTEFRETRKYQIS